MRTILHFLTFLFLCISPLCARDYRHSVSACAIFQNEAPYFSEWLAYHFLMGVEHFYLYNNNSTDNYLEVLQPWIDREIVELRDWPNSTDPGFWGYTTQPAAYRDAIKRSKGKTKWLAIIDLDEFILPMKERNIRRTLRKHYSDAAAVYVTWLQFGTGGVTVGPGESILRSLTRCAQLENMWNTIGKSIVRPDKVATCVDPHFCVLKTGIYFDGDGNPGTNVGIHHNKLLRINHYTFRDEWFFWNIKVPRCTSWSISVEELIKKNESFSIETDMKMIELLDNMR